MDYDLTTKNDNPEVQAKRLEGLNTLKLEYNEYTKLVGDRSNFFSLSIVGAIWAIYGKDGLAGLGSKTCALISLISAFLILILNILIPAIQAHSTFKQYQKLDVLDPDAKSELLKDLNKESSSIFPYSIQVQDYGQILLFARFALTSTSGIFLIIDSLQFLKN